MTMHLKSQPDHGDMHIRKVDDIKPLMHLVKHYPNGITEEWEVLSEPMRYGRISDDALASMRDEWCVVINVKRQGDRHTRKEVSYRCWCSSVR